jgi:hypothetical protein
MRQVKLRQKVHEVDHWLPREKTTCHKVAGRRRLGPFRPSIGAKRRPGKGRRRNSARVTVIVLTHQFTFGRVNAAGFFIAPHHTRGAEQSICHARKRLVAMLLWAASFEDHLSS